MKIFTNSGETKKITDATLPEIEKSISWYEETIKKYEAEKEKHPVNFTLQFKNNLVKLKAERAERIGRPKKSG